MKKILYALATTLCCVLTTFVASCSDNDDFANKPNAIDINTAIEITPIDGGLEVSWTPDPADENFVFLHIIFTDQDGKQRSYSMSRYGSSLVTPELKDENGDPYPNPNDEAVKIKINGLINQEYNLDFYAYNNDNNNISLGSRKVTPGDYTQCIPDSIYAVSFVGDAKCAILEWQEPKITSSSTLTGIRFYFTNVETGEVIKKEYEPGIYHDTITMTPGNYKVDYETFSAIGKVWKKEDLQDNIIEVLEYRLKRLWDASDKAGWSITASSEELSGENGGCANLIDGNVSTYWHNNWSGEWVAGPYIIDITLDKEESIGGFILIQRENAPNRYVRGFSIYLRNEDEEYPDEPDYIGEMQNIGDKQEFSMGFRKSANHVRISFNSSWLNAGDSSNYYSMGEFGLVVAE